MIEVIEKCDICKLTVKNIEIENSRFMEAFKVLENIRKKANKISVILRGNIDNEKGNEIIVDREKTNGRWYNKDKK